jgi:hypothetical protein
MSDSGKELITLGDALPAEIERVTKLLTHYASLGPVGMFGAEMLRQALKTASEAMASGDPIMMIRAYQKLKECN